LRKGQSPAALEMKDFSKTYRALDGYGIEKVYVERESLTERGLGEDDLVIPVELIDRAEMARLMDKMDVVLSA
jgi:tRNA 2-thiouridine synthesizing protein C